MRTQRASSPQRLALVAQLVSLGSVGDKRWISSPEPRPVVPTPLCSHRGWGGGALPMLQSSSSEPSPQSSNMLQRREDDRQRWFRQRNSFLSLQWGFWVVGGSGEGGGFRLWGLTALPRLPQRPG